MVDASVKRVAFWTSYVRDEIAIALIECY